MNNKEIILASLFAALTAVGAFIKIPIPYVPFTLQIFFVFFSAILLGGKLGLISQMVYIFTGLIGIPIFTKGGGPTYVLQPTFGYLLGFAISAYVIGKLLENKEKNFTNIFISSLIGLAVVYLLGVIYLYFNINFISGKDFDLFTAVKIGFLLPVAGDIILCLIISSISPKIINSLGDLLPISK